MMISRQAITVSQLNAYVKMLFEADSMLYKVCVTGEISNFVNHYKTGHCYFTLKDDSASVKAVMFAGNARSLKFVPENGMRVFLTGRVSVFERDGVYQIYAEKMEPEGAGELMIAFEQLKKKLSAEGLFDEKLKKKIPTYPQKIAVVTSPVGAAVQDVINVLSRRYPLAEMLMYPVAAQGINCAKENIDAIKSINNNKSADIIIICRGGGSIEDLWGYNDEQLVREIASSEIPVISGIGHETDFTLCDFASDLRAPTPSAAAELSVPDIRDLVQIFDSLILRLDNAADSYLEKTGDNLFNLSERLRVTDPVRVLANRTEGLENLKNRLIAATEKNINQKQSRYDIATAKLGILSPYEIIKKGYIPVYKNDERIRRASDISEDDRIMLGFTDGNVLCSVISKQ